MIKFSPEDITNEWELKNKINKVHEYLFYNATLQTQCEKYGEERSEYYEANTDEEKLKELADMYISACGVKRFSYAIGNDLCENVIKNYGYNKSKILLAVCEKMNKLQYREWEEVNGYYKHKVYDIDAQTGEKEGNSKTDNKK